MIFDHTEVLGVEAAIRGMLHAVGWSQSDSGICKGGSTGIGCSNCANHECKSIHCDHDFDHSFQLGKNDYELMMTLVNTHSIYANFRRMIVVYADVTAPTYWWQKFDRFEVDTVVSSVPPKYQKRTIMVNYAVLSNIYFMYKKNKLNAWRECCRWIEELPYSELITGIGDDA